MSPEEKVAEKASSEAPRSESIDPLLGKVLNGKFKILSMLATGGMGTIYRGEQLPLGRPVAIKVLIPNHASRQLDPNFHKRFFLEASILARLQHPNIVTVFDYGRIEDVEGERFFMAMEYLEGETLFRRVRRQGRLPPPEAMRIARQIARGLREAHKHGVVHRDLKPSNIMLVANEDAEEGVKIIDFGLVKMLADDSEELTQQGAFLGSPRFMSPEQISHGKVDLRTDIYSLGVILYQMLCGKVPFESEKSIQILMAHLQQPVPKLKERNPEVDIPEPLEALVMRALSKDPEGRPATMDAFIQALGECARGMGVSTGFGAPLTSIESLSGVHSFRGSTSTLRALKEAETLPAPAEEAEAAPPASAKRSQEAPPAASKATPAPVVATPEPKPSGGGKGPILIAGGLIAIAAVLFFVFGRKAPPAAEPPPTPTAAATPTEKRAASFVLMLESIPPGASVLEDGRTLGTTPLHLTIQNDAVRETPRKLTVQKEGYQPYSILQGPSEESVRLMATLVAIGQPAPSAAETADPGGPKVKGPRGPRGPAPTPTATAKASGAPPPAIVIDR
ncbi:MAG: serine/threonine protein kinase [Polyangiaceae bacterium]|nr:serine/threonine protein kinase [Polyangiaceae bacterium]